jgi:heptosyltransferase-2
MRILQMLCCIDGIFADFFTEETQYKDFNVKLNTQHMVDVPKWAAYPAIHLPGTNDVNEKLLQRLAKITSSPKRIAVFPGSVWNTKRWPVEYFAKLVQQLAEKNYTVLLMGGPGEEMYGEAIENKNGESEKVINLIGKSSVWESILVLNQCDLVIANDSASAHLAAMLNKKILVFFGPTVLSFGYRPWGNSVYVMENANLKCRPCGSHGHDKCPIGTHECMTSINAESALKKVESVLY